MVYDYGDDIPAFIEARYSARGDDRPHLIVKFLKHCQQTNATSEKAQDAANGCNVKNETDINKDRQKRILPMPKPKPMLKTPQARNYPMNAGILPEAHNNVFNAGISPQERIRNFNAGILPQALIHDFNAGVVPQTGHSVINAGISPQERIHSFNAGILPQASNHVINTGISPQARISSFNAGIVPQARNPVIKAGILKASRANATIPTTTESANVKKAKPKHVRFLDVMEVFSDNEIKKSTPESFHKVPEAKAHVSPGEIKKAPPQRPRVVPEAEEYNPVGEIKKTTANSFRKVPEATEYDPVGEIKKAPSKRFRKVPDAKKLGPDDDIQILETVPTRVSKIPDSGEPRPEKPKRTRKPPAPKKPHYEFDIYDLRNTKAMTYEEKCVLWKKVNEFNRAGIDDMIAIIDKHEQGVVDPNQQDIDFERLRPITLREIEAYIQATPNKRKPKRAPKNVPPAKTARKSTPKEKKERPVYKNGWLNLSESSSSDSDGSSDSSSTGSSDSGDSSDSSADSDDSTHTAIPPSPERSSTNSDPLPPVNEAKNSNIDYSEIEQCADFDGDF